MNVPLSFRIFSRKAVRDLGGKRFWGVPVGVGSSSQQIGNTFAKNFFILKNNFLAQELPLCCSSPQAKVNFVFLFRGWRKRKPFCSATTLKQKNLFLLACGRQDGQTESPKRYFRPNLSLIHI